MPLLLRPRPRCRPSRSARRSARPLASARAGAGVWRDRRRWSDRVGPLCLGLIDYAIHLPALVRAAALVGMLVAGGLAIVRIRRQLVRR